jgi:hypothetical protein
MLALLLIGLFLVFSAMGGDESSKPVTERVNHTDDDTRALLTGNEVMSRNQLNLLSEVTNEFYDCIGAGACVFTDSVDNSQVDNSQWADNSTQRTEVQGERNTIVHSDGTMACESPTQPGAYSPDYCE